MGRSPQKLIFERLTEAIQLLANKGSWDPLIGFADICGGETDVRTFSLPDDVETPLAINICGQPAYMRSKWSEFHLNGLGSNRETTWTWDDQGPQPVIQDIIRPSTLLALADLKNDLGTRIRVFGHDVAGRRMREQNADGSWQDGFIIQPSLITDFPSQAVTENTTRLFVRNFSAIPVTTLVSTDEHGFRTGVAVVLTVTVGTLPSPLINGATYYVRVINENTVSLHYFAAEALSGVNPIEMTGVSGSTVIQLQDRRQVQVQTKFTSDDPLGFLEGSSVTFTGTTLPEPIVGPEIFYIHLLDDRNFTIHATQAEALSASNPLFVTTPGSNDVMANASQPVTPYTKLVFSVPHRFIQNDVVTVSNASGNLPNPLLPATNYYVRYLNELEITLHASLSDAASGNNPIILTDNGTGTSSVVKLIPATANVGSSNNINAPNSNLQPGDFVQFASSGNLPNPLLSSQIYVVVAPVSGNTFTIAQPPAISIATLAKGRANNTAIIVTAVDHGLVTGNVVNIAGLGGSGYNLNQVTITVLASNAFSYNSTGGNDAAIASLSRSRSSGIATIETAAPHGFTTGDFINVQGFGGASYNQPWVEVNVESTTAFWYNNPGVNDFGFATTFRARGPDAGLPPNIAQITTIAPHGLSTGQYVNIQNMTDVTYNNPWAQVTVVDPTNFTYAAPGGTVASTADTQGYVAIPQSDSGGLLTLPLSDGAGIVSGNLINITDTGNGVLNAVISRAFTIGFYDDWFLDASQLDTGASFKINSTGSLPGTEPSLSPSGTYYIRKEDDFTAKFFVSEAKAEDSVVRLSASRSRSSNVAQIVTQGNHGFANGDRVEISSMSDDSYNPTPYSSVAVTVVNATTFTYLNTGPDEGSTVDTAGQIIFSPINILSLGAGETDLILSRLVAATVLSNLLEVSSSAYITPGTIYQFTTSGTLPSPLVLATDYKISVINGLLQISDTSDAVIILTDIGSGEHYIQRQFDFTVDIPQGVRCLANEYNNGDAVIVNPEGMDNTAVAPEPLVNGTTYFLRRIDDETVAIYDTKEAALDLESTSGLIVVTSAGTGQSIFLQILPAFQIQRVDRVLLINGKTASQAELPEETPIGSQPPPLRNGYIDLYAWDYGRKCNLTLLGHYSPQETEPYYRRIKIALHSTWIRMRYRRKTFRITSLNDYIPLTSEMALLYMVRSQELFRTNFMDEGAKYEALAVQYLQEENDIRQGPATYQIQFQDDGVFNSKSFWMT